MVIVLFAIKNAWYKFVSKSVAAAVFGTFRTTLVNRVIFSIYQISPELMYDILCPCLCSNIQFFFFENQRFVLQVADVDPQPFSFRPSPKFSYRQIGHVTENQ